MRALARPRAGARRRRRRRRPRRRRHRPARTPRPSAGRRRRRCRWPSPPRRRAAVLVVVGEEAAEAREHRLLRRLCAGAGRPAAQARARQTCSGRAAASGSCPGSRALLCRRGRARGRCGPRRERARRRAWRGGGEARAQHHFGRSTRGACPRASAATSDGASSCSPRRRGRAALQGTDIWVLRAGGTAFERPHARVAVRRRRR